MLIIKSTSQLYLRVLYLSKSTTTGHELCAVLSVVRTYFDFYLKSTLWLFVYTLPKSNAATICHKIYS